MTWVAVGVGVISAGSAAYSAHAAQGAAATQARGARDAAAVQQNIFNTTTANETPFMQSGYGAQNRLNYLLGVSPQTANGGVPGAPGSSAPQVGGGTFKPSDIVRLRGQGMSLNDILKLGTLSNNQGAKEYSYLQQNGLSPDDINSLLTGTFQPTGGAKAGASDYMPTPNGGVQRVVGQGDGGGSIPGATGTGDNGDGQFGSLTRSFSPQDFAAGIDPGYSWRLQQGNQGVMNGAAAGSGSLSGPALKSLLDYNQGAASQEYGAAFDRFQTQQGNIYQRLFGVAGLGQNAAANVGNQGVATGGNIGSNITGAANASAAGQVGTANAISGAVNNLGSLAYLYATRPGASATGTGP